MSFCRTYFVTPGSPDYQFLYLAILSIYSSKLYTVITKARPGPAGAARPFQVRTRPIDLARAFEDTWEYLSRACDGGNGPSFSRPKTLLHFRPLLCRTLSHCQCTLILNTSLFSLTRVFPRGRRYPLSNFTFRWVSNALSNLHPENRPPTRISHPLARKKLSPKKTPV